MKRTRQAFIGIIGMALLLTGCAGDVPQLSEKDSALVTQYAVASLQKYDANHTSRLVDTEKIEQERAQKAEKEAVLKAQKEKEENAKAEAEAQQTSSEEGMTSNQEEKPELPAYTNISEFLQIPEMDIQYAGYEICDKFPKDDMTFAVSAAQGEKLIVMKFNAVNQAEADQLLDVMSQELKVTVALNGEETIKIMTTMLVNDFAMYQESIQKGSTQEMVLLMELPEQRAENLTSLIMTMRKADAAMEIDLLQ